MALSRAVTLRKDKKQHEPCVCVHVFVLSSVIYWLTDFAESNPDLESHFYSVY